MRLRLSYLGVVGTSIVAWMVYSTSAFAASGGAVHSPSLWDQAVDSFASLINLVADYMPWHDYGIAVMVVTILVRFLTVPLMMKNLRNSKKMQMLQPQMKELKQRFPNDPKKYQEQVMALYKAENVNPLAGCMPMLLQTVIFWIFFRGIYTDKLVMTHKFLGILPLGAHDPTYILPVLAAVTSFLQQKVSMVQTDPSQKMLLYVFPIMVFFISFNYTSALALYWVVSNVFTIGQMYFVRVKPSQVVQGREVR